MKRILAAVALGLVVVTAGCAPPSTGADLSDNRQLDSESAARVAEQIAAEQTAVQVQSVAQVWVGMEGDMAGFAASFPASEPGLASQIREITDSSVTLEFEPGRCVRAPLPSGPVATISC